MLGLRSCPVNFKEVFATRIIQLHINPFYTVTRFLETVTPILQNELNVNGIEIVEAGQTINGIPSEAAPALHQSDTRLCDIWGQSLKNVSFYLRRKNYRYPEFDSNIESIAETSVVDTVTSQSVEECPICLETTRLTQRYNCAHGICSLCYHQCQLEEITFCSLCRST
jgi:hypothetical protein